ncbi:hypothetical protein JVT61DRAFT_6307 [Boletus reticuloceps]|uniref:Uncharacterized protein n=1 Tax=Boletus reticuloceps TaxID=495285 RepID=A0A8I2YJL6_9AGAM|nr:hypothetical protein JVT61DRAFT_6307 [Boletus reticuloceps]
MLMLLAHHKLVDDRETLGLKELEVREEILKLVADFVSLDMIQPQLWMISPRTWEDARDGQKYVYFFLCRVQPTEIDKVGGVRSVLPPTLIDMTSGTNPPASTKDTVSLKATTEKNIGRSMIRRAPRRHRGSCCRHPSW